MQGALLTGGTGTLGCELVELLPGIAAPSSRTMDVTDPASVRATLMGLRPSVIVHAAAYTDVLAAEQERARCWRVNVEGTRNVARLARELDARLIHISTDYVFDGEQGGYHEDEPPGPVRNYYALSKLVAEEAALTSPHCLILRTSFRPREWPYASAFADMWTSQDWVDVIAPDIALAVRHAAHIPFSVLHIATGRKSVHDLAVQRRPGVRAGKRADANVHLPKDTSLDTTRWKHVRSELMALESGAGR